jgi:hypothetical protein
MGFSSGGDGLLWPEGSIGRTALSRGKKPENNEEVTVSGWGFKTIFNYLFITFII